MLRLLTALFCVAALASTADAVTPLCEYMFLEEEVLTQPVTPMWVGPGDTLYAYFQWPVNMVLRSGDRGDTWAAIHMFEGSSTCKGLFVDSRGTIFLCRSSPNDNPNYGKLQRGRYEGTRGRVWSEPFTFVCGDGFWKMCEDLDGNLFIGEYAGDYDDTCAYIWRSTDEGTTWESVYEGPQRHVHFVACDPYTGFLYAALGDGLAPLPRAKLMRSDDNGDTWNVISGPLWGLYAQPISIVCTPTHRIFGSDWGAGFWPWNSIYWTPDDDARDDKLILINEENTYVWMMSMDPNGIIFAGTVTRDAGGQMPAIYASHDNGDHWCKIKDLGVVEDPWSGITWMTNFDSEGWAYYHDDSVFETRRFRLSPESGVDTPGGSSARLSAPSPNPFAERTTVAYDVLDGVGHVALAIYDLRGRHVRTLVDGTPGPGRHPASWDGRDEFDRPVASGVYFVRLEVGGKASGQKLLLMK